MKALKRIYIYSAIILFFSVLFLGAYSLHIRERIIVLKVFHAGSLTLPFEWIRDRFEADFSSYRPSGSQVTYKVHVDLEPAGSIQCIRKIVDVGKSADVLAVADYLLIPNMMGDYASWYLKFARNRIVICYTNGSRYSSKVNETNWFKILLRDGVRWGFANPNLDPCGYRVPWVIQLAEFEYDEDMIFENLIEAYSAITMRREGELYVYSSPEDLMPETSKLVIRDKSVDLVAMLESGGIDYAFEYLSVAVQHGLNYVLLPVNIDLSGEDSFHLQLYSRLRAVTLKGNLTASPIVYGITVPTCSEHPELANQFVKYVISEFGQNVFKEMGQTPLVPAVTSNLDSTPKVLIPYCVED